MFSTRPLADLPTELHDPTGWAAPGTSLCLHGVPVPSRVLGFSVAWHRGGLDLAATAPTPDAALAFAAIEPAGPVASRPDRHEPSAPTPLRLVGPERRSRTGDRRRTAAA